ncbi:uncharacterized protein EI90DRAFT_3023409 [Cantharellus anzutake]|uniref:uncharacterized protein n=1 Tax=Cantharellus anzutake TaxID=1750568 RepID=UPI0019052352|nr:uncharacterized protein EI90DRAFT_3023409 [Cantharellus anzutake]KAF8311780.1 hypothetical protein EI90DRAFT_3023409 [Cantharellus anzutake]
MSTVQTAKSPVSLVKRGQMEGWIPNHIVAAGAITTLGKVTILETDEMSTNADSHGSDSKLEYLIERVRNNLSQRQTVDRELLERVGGILEESCQQSDSKHMKTKTEEVKITQIATVDMDSEDLQDVELQYPKSSIAEYAYNWTDPPINQVASVPHNSPEPTWGPTQSSYVPHVGTMASPAFAKLLKEKMCTDYDQGYPKGIKFISILLNKHLTQLERDLDKTWRTTQECTSLIQDEIVLRENPHRMGTLFKLHETRLLKLQEFDPKTMEELQVAMEMYRLDQDVLFANETWPVERRERYWR